MVHYIPHGNPDRCPVTRQRKVLDRQQARAKLSPQEQLTALDFRLGIGVGARKERARLSELIKKASQDKRRAA